MSPSSAPTRSASATKSCSASEITAPRPPRMSGRCARTSASASRSTARGSGCRRPGAGGSSSGGRLDASGACCTSSGMLKHHGLPVAQRARDGAQRVFARRVRRMQPLRHRADGAHHLGLLDVKIVLHRAVRHVARQHHERRPAFRGLADAGERIGQPRAGMHADQRQFAGRLGIGVAHAGGVAFVARGNQLDAGFDQPMGDLEIGGAEEAEAAPRAVAGEVLGDHASRPLDCHSSTPPSLPTEAKTSK